MQWQIHAIEQDVLRGDVFDEACASLSINHHRKPFLTCAAAAASRWHAVDRAVPGLEIDLCFKPSAY
jgi:hypothetical protein